MTKEAGLHDRALPRERRARAAEPFGMLRASVAAALLATACCTGAQAQSERPATALLVAMRVDDQFRAQLDGVRRARCAAAPDGARADCLRQAAEALPDLDDPRQIAVAMTPWVVRSYTEEEIATLGAFLAGPDGRRFASMMISGMGYRISPDRVPPPEPIDPETQRRMNAFFGTATGRKFVQSLPEFKREMDRQTHAHFCATLARRGSSCAALGLAPPPPA
jgi:hypothetical protein